MGAVNHIKKYNKIVANKSLQNKSYVGNALYWLQEDIKKGNVKVTDKFKHEIECVQKNLVDWLNEGKELVVVEYEQIKKLGVKLSNSATNNQKFTFDELAKIKFKLVDLGEYNEIMGKISLPFSMMIYGKPGNGKTTYALGLLKKFYQKGKRVLFVSNEEGKRASLQDKIIRLGMQKLPINTQTNLEKTVFNYDFVVCDSISSLGLGEKEVKDLIEKGEETNTSFALINQSTKEGKYKGVSGIAHLVEIVQRVHLGVVYNDKNRLGGSGEFQVKFR